MQFLSPTTCLFTVSTETFCQSCAVSGTDPYETSRRCCLLISGGEPARRLSRKRDNSFDRRPDRGSQPTVHAAGKTGIAAQEKAAPFFLALDAGTALDDGP